jgi:UDP-2,4-diacetamido-2,4,6-trideoxy-beta-L-altropyranose hydrolase
MRCLTLAAALQAAGSHCRFICREHPGNLVAEIRKHGFAVSVLPTATEVFKPNDLSVASQSIYPAWLGAYWPIDVAESKNAIGETMVDWLIVDHYAIDARWEQALRPRCSKLMVIDDLADRQHDCDLILDQNLGRVASDYSQLVPRGCTVLAGPLYALLRPEYAALRFVSLGRRAAPQLENLLITMGGVDQNDVTGKVLEALKHCQLPTNLHITVVMGIHAPWLERVQLLAKQMQQPTVVKNNVKNMAQLMCDSDFAIGAAGSTSWERCCLGLPTLMVVLAENQRNIASALLKSGSVKVLDSLDTIPQALQSAFNSIVTTDALSQLSQKSCLITDGQGTSRVMKVLSVHHG